MNKDRSVSVSRRTVLRAGGAAVALPLLESLWPREARAQAAPFPKRFVVFFSANGTIANNWEPSGSETSFELSPILKPLESHRDDLIILQGIDQQGGGGDGHQSGIGGMLTGTNLNPGPFRSMGTSAGWAAGISVDQRIANEIGKDTRFSSLELGVQVGIADDWGRMCYAGSDQPLPPDDDPNSIFARVFSDLTKDPAELAAIRAHRRSVLDRVLARFNAVSARVSADDRKKLEAHADALRDIEARLDAQAMPQAACHAPSLDSLPADIYANDSYPAVGKLQMDMLVMALACDLTRVASLQWSRSVSQVRFTWLGINDGHHDLSHRGDDDADAQDKLTRINTWYASQLAYLLDQLKAIPEGDGTLLDNTVVLWCNELAKGNVHSRTDAPYVLAGHAGGALRTGRYLRYGTVPHNNLLVSLLNAMGIPDTTFGRPDWCTGALSELSG